MISPGCATLAAAEMVRKGALLLPEFESFPFFETKYSVAEELRENSVRMINTNKLFFFIAKK